MTFSKSRTNKNRQYAAAYGASSLRLYGRANGSGKPASLKQNETRERNWYIRKLRAYYHLCPFRGQDRNAKKARRTIEALIDAELIRLGAEPETKRVKRRSRELEKELGVNSQLATQDFDFPEFKLTLS